MFFLVSGAGSNRLMSYAYSVPIRLERYPDTGFLVCSRFAVQFAPQVGNAPTLILGFIPPIALFIGLSAVSPC